MIATDGDLPEGVIPEPAAGSAGLVAYNASDDQFDYFAPLSCVPMEPYYPGFGETVWTGCLNSTWKWSSSIIGFNVQSKTVVANISCPFYAWDMTFDTATGQFVVAGYTESGSASAPNFGEFYANSSSMASYALPAISLQNWDGYVGSEMTFDPRTDVILAPSNGTALLAINAASPATVPATQLPGPAVASVLDPALNVVLVATESPAALVEINETTYATEGMYTSPLCGGSDCGPANDILLVPALGDVVLSAVAYLLVVHVDTLSLIGTVESGTFEGPSSVFLPHDDQVLSTWSIYLPGYPLFLSQLEFGNSTSLTTLLWLPSSLGVLLVAGFLGAAIGITLTASRSRNRVQ